MAPLAPATNTFIAPAPPGLVEHHVVLGEFLERQELFAHHHKVAECEWPGDERVAEATTGRVEDDAGDEPVAIRMARTA